jgi:ubiquinone/menaquinone biosynthesis C-methylase UbiE
MPTFAESEQQRSKRHRRRTLFDGVATLYDSSRPQYPDELIEFVASTAGLGPNSRVLEVGCGTGQLTQSLVRLGFDLTAIDIGPSMIATARRRLADSAVSLLATSFEDFAAADASFDLIVSGTAFHWVDPEIKFDKSARLLRPGGWLAVLATREQYDDPLGAALHEMWVARSDDRGAWATSPEPTNAELMAETRLFAPAIYRTHQRRLVMPADAVVAVENTRATSLSWPADVRHEFTEELRRRIGSRTEVPLTQHATLTVAQVVRNR